MLALSGSRSARATLSRRLPEGEGLAPRQLDSHFACVTSAGTKSKIQDVKLNLLEQSIREMSKLQVCSLREHYTIFNRNSEKPSILSSNNPCDHRRMLVVPYVRSWYRIGISLIFIFSFRAPNRRSKSPNGSKSPKAARLAAIRK